MSCGMSDKTEPNLRWHCVTALGRCPPEAMHDVWTVTKAPKAKCEKDAELF
jgi:hypothetical protein